MAITSFDFYMDIHEPSVACFVFTTDQWSKAKKGIFKGGSRAFLGGGTPLGGYPARPPLKMTFLGFRTLGHLCLKQKNDHFYVVFGTTKMVIFLKQSIKH